MSRPDVTLSSEPGIQHPLDCVERLTKARVWSAVDFRRRRSDVIFEGIERMMANG
jgi:hypothetical protein